VPDENPRLFQPISVAAANAADVVAVGVELANPDKSDDVQYRARVGNNAHNTGLT
jgi:hypothetical protein